MEKESLKMFNTKLMEIKDYSYQHDSFSSGSDQEDAKVAYHRRKSTSPRRAIPHEYAKTADQKAKAGIFVVDPFHYKINIEFLKAFAQHHSTQPAYLRQSSAYYFSSSSSDEDADEESQIINALAPDVSYMGFTTGSSSEDEQNSNSNHHNHNHNHNHNHHHNHYFDDLDHPKKKSSKKAKTNGHSSSISAKIVNSSSLPRPADNSSKFPDILTPEAVTKLAHRVNSQYKNFPQNHRHGSTPMDISTCPGVKLLNEDEYIACSLLRIRPALYFHARNTLLHNFHHSVGYFRKSAAQKMLRIDVNKTGKLYDFLVRQHWLPEVEGGDCRPEPEQIIVDDPETYHQL